MMHMALPLVSGGTTVRIETHFHWYNCTWTEDDIDITVYATTTPEQLALWLAAYETNHLPGRAATAQGNVVSFTSTVAEIERGFGAVSVR